MFVKEYGLHSFSKVAEEKLSPPLSPSVQSKQYYSFDRLDMASSYQAWHSCRKQLFPFIFQREKKNQGVGYWRRIIVIFKKKIQYLKHIGKSLTIWTLNNMDLFVGQIGSLSYVYFLFKN